MRRVAVLLIVTSGALSAGALRGDVGDVRSREIPPRTSELGSRSLSGASRAKSPGSDWTTTAFTLSLVVAALFGAAKFLRPRGSSAPVTLPAEAIDVLGRKALDYRHSLHLVRCGSRLLVLGSSADGLSMLTEINDPDEVEELVDLCRAPGPATISDAFSNFASRFRPDEVAERESDPAILRLKERLAADSPRDPADDLPPARETYE